MVRTGTQTHRTQSGTLMTELMIAMALLAGALLPLAYAMSEEHKLARATYQRAVAMEIVDGEMELLAGDGGRSFTNGTQPYAVHALAATNLPPGAFTLIKTPERLRLVWTPTQAHHGGSVVREVNLR
jgi:hypothetical protein